VWRRPTGKRRKGCKDKRRGGYRPKPENAMIKISRAKEVRR